LADYQAHLNELKAAEIDAVGLSVDPLEKARETLDKLKLEFPLVWGLKVPDDADRIGAWCDDKRPMIQPSEFLLGRDGKILGATYSTGPIGRLRAEDVLSLVHFMESRK
jgi:peroxiredoxin